MMEWKDSKEMKEYLSQHIDDKEFVMEALKTINWPSPQMSAMPDELCDDEDVALYLINHNSSPEKEFSYASLRLKKDKQFIYRLITESSSRLGLMEFCDESIKSDREFILSLNLPENAGGPHRDFILKYLSPKLQDDEEIVYQCCKSDVGAIRYASNRLKNDSEFVLSILGFRNWTGPVDYLLEGEPIIQNTDFIKAAFEKTGDIDFKDAPDSIKNDRLLILKALQGRYMPYYYVEDAMMSMYYISSPFGGVHSIHISNEVLNDPEFAKLIADKYFASEIGKPHIDKYPQKITDIYDIMDEIAYEGHCYWYSEVPESVFDFTEEIAALEKRNKR